MGLLWILQTEHCTICAMWGRSTVVRHHRILVYLYDNMQHNLNQADLTQMPQKYVQVFPHIAALSKSLVVILQRECSECAGLTQDLIHPPL